MYMSLELEKGILVLVLTVMKTLEKHKECKLMHIKQVGYLYSMLFHMPLLLALYF